MLLGFNRTLSLYLQADHNYKKRKMRFKSHLKCEIENMVLGELSSMTAWKWAGGTHFYDTRYEGVGKTAIFASQKDEGVSISGQIYVAF